MNGVSYIDVVSSTSKEWYRENYELLEEIVLIDKHRQYIGDLKSPACRYCKKEKPLTSFKKKAHTFPEFIGNKHLFSNDECDRCNELFGSTFENDFAAYLGPHRTLLKIKGKRGIPVYNPPNKKQRINFNKLDSEILIESEIGDDLVEFDLIRRQVRIKADRQPYRKRNVYKAILKMALAILPKNELSNYNEAIEWLLCDSDPEFPCPIFGIIGRSDDSLNGIYAVLLRRIRDCGNVPYMSFLIWFSHLTFQIILPTPHKDAHIIGANVGFIPMVTCLEKRTTPRFIRENMESNEIVYGERDNIVFNYEEIIL